MDESVQTAAPMTVRTGEDFSLRIKLVLTLVVLSVLPLVFVVLHTISVYGSVINAAIAALSNTPAQAAITAAFGRALRGLLLYVGLYTVLIVVGFYFADKILVAPVKQLGAWLERARKGSFASIEPAPIRTHDEFGLLAFEMEQSIRFFREAEEREKQIAEEKSEFIAVAAHQLRTPLTGMRWAIESLQDGEMSADKTQLLSQLSSTAERMVRLVDDVLDVVKIEEGKFGYEYAMVDLVAPFTKLVEEFQLVAKSRGVALVLKASPGLTAYVDLDRVVLAVTNLLSNAIDYTKQGGSVSLTLTDEVSHVRIDVSDTGIGIAPDDQKRLFTKFYRGENARHMRPDGSGLGLYIVRNVALRHGGDISVVTAEGKGTTFSFTVPKDKLAMGKLQPSVAKFFAGF